MGGEQPMANYHPTQNAIDEALMILFPVQKPDKAFAMSFIYMYVQNILVNIRSKGVFSTSEHGILVNPTWIKVFFTKKYEVGLSAIIDSLNQDLQKFIGRKWHLLVKRQDYRKYTDVINLLLFLTDERTIRQLNTLTIRSDLHPKVKELMKPYMSMQISNNPLTLLELNELSRIEKSLRMTILLTIDMHLKIISRSDFTLEVIRRLQVSAWAMYVKVILSSPGQIEKRAKGECFKSNLKMAGYFIGMSINNKQSSLYQISVIFITYLLTDAQNIKDGKSFPPHLFKHLPIISSNSLIQYIASNILYSLIYQPNTKASKFQFNRITAIKLLPQLLKEITKPTQQLQYYLQEVCMQVKPGQIQRAYLYEMASKYSTELFPTSSILKKIAELGNINYNVKYANKSMKVSPQDIVTELEGDGESLKQELALVSEKFLFQQILQKPITYNYDEKLLWNQIMVGLVENSGKGSKSNHKELKLEEKEEEDERHDQHLQEHYKAKIEERNNKIEE